MSGFREHFLDKYFGYRRRYVAAVAEIAPNRRRLAVSSEIARLGFSAAACALVVFIVAIPFARSLGHASPIWELSFAAMFLAPLILGCYALAGIRNAWLDRAGPSRGAHA